MTHRGHRASLGGTGRTTLRFVSFDYRYPPGWIYGNKDDGDSIMKLDPIPLSETWMGMERLVEQGLVKSIGVCNYNSGLIIR